MAARIPDWVTISPSEVSDLLRRLIADVQKPGETAAMRLHMNVLVWVLGDGSAPITGRPDQPVTAEAAEVEWWSALAAKEPKTAHLAPLPEVSEQLGVVYRPPNEVSYLVADATWTVLTWLLGIQDQHGTHGMVAWLFEGPLPTPDELYDQAMEIDPDAHQSPRRQALVRQRVERDAIRHRRMAMWIRRFEESRGTATDTA